jgi:Tripartite tricarboxylate transporter TctB family
MAHEDEAADGRSGVATSTVEALVALVLLVIGVVVIVESRRLGAGWTSDGPGAGYFPFLIGLIITVSGAGILYQALRGKNRRTEPFVDRA